MQDRLQTLRKRLQLERLSSLTSHSVFEPIVVGLTASLAILMLLSFLITDWYALDALDVSNSGLDVMLGIGNDGEPFGRVIDLLLIIVPLGAITQIVLAAMTLTRRLPFNYALLSMVVVAMLLLVVPLVWQGLSTNAFRGDAEGEALDTLIDGYSTAEQFWLGFVGVMVSGFAATLLFGAQLGFWTVTEEGDVAAEPSPSTEGGSSS